MAVTEKPTDDPWQALLELGWLVIEGGVSTVTVALPLPVFEQFASFTLVTL